MADAFPWTFAAAGDVSERLDWLTDVMHAPTGPEQRRRQREAPRVFLDFDTLHSGASRRQMEHAITLNGAGSWDVPLMPDATVLEVGASDGTTTLELDARLRRFRVGGRALVMAQDPRQFEVHAIEAVSDTEIELATALASSWPAGTAVVPLVEGRLDSVPLLPRFTGDDVQTRISFRLLEVMDWSDEHGMPTYRGAPVLELDIGWATDPEHRPDRDVAVVDNATGVPAYFDQPGIPLAAYRFQCDLVGRDARAGFRSLLYGLAGRWTPIWIPSKAQDLVPVAPLASGSPVMDVQWAGISQWPLQVNRRDLRIELLDGTVIYRRITERSEISASVERLVLDANLGVDVGASDVVLVSFLSLCRQESDTNLLRYWSEDVLSSELGFRGFKHEL